jgi:hypothetical protein
MLRVSASTLSRRQDLHREMRGERDVVLPPREVLRLAAVYRNRSINDVAQELLDHANEHDPSALPGIESEIQEYFAERSVTSEREELLRLSRRLLSQKAQAAVSADLERKPRDFPSVITGWVPIVEDER